MKTKPTNRKPSKPSKSTPKPLPNPFAFEPSPASTGTSSRPVGRPVATPLAKEDTHAIATFRAQHEADPNYPVRIREKAHLSQAHFASILGVSQATLSRWEDGTRVPSNALFLSWYLALLTLEHCSTTRHTTAWAVDFITQYFKRARKEARKAKKEESK